MQRKVTGHVMIALAGLALASAPCAGELIDFNGYNEANLNGQDGWVCGNAGDWFVWHRTADPADRVMWNNKSNGTATWATRNFATPLRMGTLTYEIRCNNATAAYVGWVLIRDQAQTGYLTQVAARYHSGNGTYEFFLVTAHGTAGSSSDGVSLSFDANTIYEVRIDFDLDDITAGPEGTCHVYVTRLNDSTLVWSKANWRSNSTLSDIGNFLENGGNLNAGHATWYDNIELKPPAPTGGTMVLVR